MNTELEKLIEKVVKELKSEYPDVTLEQDMLDMIDVTSLLSSDKGMQAVRYFISLMQSPELFVSPSRKNPSVGLMYAYLVGEYK